MKELLIESYKTTKKMTGIDPSKPGNMKQILVDDNAFGTYVRALAEGIDQSQFKDFARLAQNTRKTLLENSMYTLNPYETLALPLLRVFFPKQSLKSW